MKRVLFALSILCCPALGQSTTRVIHVWIDTDNWSEAKLLKQLNASGASKHWEFQQVNPGEPYEYHIVFDPSGEDVDTAYGTIHAHEASTTVYAASEKLFTFDRAQRFSEGGASNAVAKEIVKRLYLLEKK